MIYCVSFNVRAHWVSHNSWFKLSDIISQQNSDTIFLPVNFVKNSSKLQTSTVQRILLQHGVDHSDRTQQYYILGKKSFEVFSEQKTLALGLLSVLLYWLATPEPVMSAVNQTVKAQKSGSRVSSTGLPGAKHIKALASPSLSELCLQKPLWIHVLF